MVGGFPSKSEGNIFVVRWRTLVVERDAMLIDVIVELLAAAVRTRLRGLPLALEFDAQAEELAGAVTLFGPRSNFQQVVLPVDFDERLALQVRMLIGPFVAVAEQRSAAGSGFICHGEILLVIVAGARCGRTTY